MGEQELENMFDWAGLSVVFERHAYKIWLSGLEESIDAELLDNFSNAYSFESDEAMYYDEFLFHLKIFKGICKNNEMPYRYW